MAYEYDDAGPLVIPDDVARDGTYNYVYPGPTIPPSGAASTASQVESGGSGLNWNGLVNKFLDSYVAIENNPGNGWGTVPAGYQRAANGTLYPVLGAGGTAMPVQSRSILPWLLIGGVVLFAMKAAK